MRSSLAIVHSRRDDSLGKQADAELVRALGWTVLALTAIPALFTLLGLLAGSRFWLWWAVGQVLIGLGCLGVSAYISAAATRRARRKVHRFRTEEQAALAAENYQSPAA